MRSPFLPTIPEAAILLAYPATLLLGSLYSTLTIDPTISPYNPLTQSHDPATAPSYFARKDNIFNVLFVKKGWGWTTLAFLLLHLLPRFLPPAPISPSSATSTPRLLRAAARWSALTLAWLFTTQWAFGPALIDRTFALSGGACDPSPLGLDQTSPVNVAGTGTAGGKLTGQTKVQDLVTGAACRAAGGAWRGGHDISGHVFLLILGSGALVLEVLPSLLRGVGEEREKERQGQRGRDDGVVVGWGTRVALAVAGLEWWMLLMTAAYFHTWFEKFTGLVVAMSVLFTVYFAPKGVGALRQVLGAPGT